MEGDSSFVISKRNLTKYVLNSVFELYLYFIIFPVFNFIYVCSIILAGFIDLKCSKCRPKSVENSKKSWNSKERLKMYKFMTKKVVFLAISVGTKYMT